MELKTQKLYEFGPYRLDTEERVLFRHQQPLSLTPKAFDTLLLLVQNGGRVLDKERMLKAIWPNTYVEEANLAVNISALRKVLGEREGGGQYIETIPRRGYRFIANVTLIEPSTGIVSEAESAARAAGLLDMSVSEEARGLTPQPSTAIQPPPQRLVKPLIAGAIVLILALAGIGFLVWKPAAQPRRIAVMPFYNFKPSEETEHLSLALADSIITKLNYVSGVVVLPTSYVSRYRNQEIDVKQVARDLKVNTLLAGSFQKEGDEILITAQLIDLQEERPLWSDTFRLKYNRIIELQDRVSQQIIENLAVQLSPAEKVQLDREVTRNADAYEQYLQGVDLYQTNKFASALDRLERAVKLDPAFALAWAHLGRAQSASAAFQLEGAEAYRKAQASYDRALELDRDLIEAHIFKANLLTDTGRASEAIPLLREVQKTNPNLAEAHWELGYAYRFGGLIEESIRECERARQLDPEVKLYSSALNSYLYNGEYDKFLATLPDREIGYILFYRGYANYYKGNVKDAAAYFDRAYELNRDLYSRTGKALSLGIQGRNQEGIELLRDTRQMIEERNVGDAEGIYKVAQAYAVLGDREAALRVLRRSIEGGFIAYPYFVSDPLLKPLHGAAEYVELMELARARHEEFKRTFA
jgi:DNA-binding winged helix-turn-helix (wHTH) protein/TolB-like protein